MKKSKTVQPAAQPVERNKTLFPWRWVLPLAALVTALAIYGPSISGPFVYDDLSLPFLRPGYERMPFLGWISGVRPVLMASYWANFQMSGLDTTAYHAVNVLLHACNALLLGLAIRKIAASDWLGVLCGAIFLVHPIQTEAVSYVASRSENLTVFLFFAAFALFLYRKTVAIDWVASAGVLILFGLACLAKEYAVMLPLLLLLTDLYFNNEGPKSNWRLYAPIAVVGAGGAWFAWGILRGADTAGFNLKDLSPADYFFTQCRAIWVYIAKFLLPVGLNIDHDFAISRGPLDHGAIFGLVALLAASGAAFWFRKQFPIASYGWFVFLLLLAPTSSFLPIQDVLVERRVYLPMIGLLLILAEALKRVNIPKAAYAAPIAIFCVLTYQRNILWAEPFALWQDAAEKSPAKWRVQFQAADALYRRGDCAQAAAAFEKTSALGKPDYRVLINWANALDCAGQAQPAFARAEQALALEKTAQAYAFLGMLHAKQNRTAEALSTLNQAIAIDPRFDPAYFYRGNVYTMLGEQDKAVADYKQALEINPANAQAARGLARANRR